MKRPLLLLLVAGMTLLSVIPPVASAAPAPGDASAAGAQEPPLCTDKSSLKAIRQGYDFVESQKGSLKVKEINGVTQIRLGPPPKGVNQYATKTTYAVTSRSCQATVLLSDGKTDSVFWRMDYLVEGNGHSINYDSCALRQDLVDAKCERHRAGG